MNKTACALGFFDGVHKAHSHILTTCAAFAKENSLKSVALTFERSPSEFFGGRPDYLTTFEQKKELIRSLGIDELIALPVTKELLSLSPEDFVHNVLSKELSAAAVFCGFNYTFGKNAIGNAETLRELCGKAGIDVYVADKMLIDGTVVSSSEIRSALSRGDVEKANGLLGRAYEVEGIVEVGKHLGSRLGFPTANIYPDFSPLKRGVYCTRVSFDGKLYDAVTNIGVNPTVSDNALRVESHLLEFGEDLYGKPISVSFYKFLRGEKKFSSVEELRKQVEKDKLNAREFFA